MNRKIKQQHSIDILFLLVIFLLFAFSGATLLVLATHFYQSTVARSEENSSARVAAAYVREVLHQNDSSEACNISEFDGTSCLRIPQEEDYVLYLYYYDGELKELYTKEDAVVSAGNGQKILELQSFSIEEIATGVFEMECEDSLGNFERVIVSHKSSERSAEYENAGE